MLDPKLTHAFDQGIAAARLMGAMVGAYYQGLAEQGVPESDRMVLAACHASELLAQATRPADGEAPRG